MPGKGSKYWEFYDLSGRITSMHPCRFTRDIKQFDVCSHARLLRDGCANLQDYLKTKREVAQYPQCSRAAIVRFSVVVISFAEFLWQPCNKAQFHCTVILP